MWLLKIVRVSTFVHVMNISFLYENKFMQRIVTLEQERSWARTKLGCTRAMLKAGFLIKFAKNFYHTNGSNFHFHTNGRNFIQACNFT